MDEKINEFDDLIKQKTNNYKNVCLLWKNWIKIKKKRFSEELDSAIEKIKHIENHIDNDIPIETLIILSTLRELDL